MRNIRKFMNKVYLQVLTKIKVPKIIQMK